MGPFKFLIFFIIADNCQNQSNNDNNSPIKEILFLSHWESFVLFKQIQKIKRNKGGQSVFYPTHPIIIKDSMGEIEYFHHCCDGK